MQTEPTLLLSRSDAEQLLSISECMDAIEEAFRSLGEGKISSPGILSVKTANGSLHVKTASFTTDRKYIVAKLNTNFPINRTRLGLPTIQGVILLDRKSVV